MKPSKLFLICCLVLAGVLGFTACPTESGGGGGGGIDYNDTPLDSFVGTTWTDDLIPESTIEFTTGTSVTLTGRYWDKKIEINGQQQSITNLSGPHTYETDSDLNAAKVVYILMDAAKRTGIKLYYYKADETTGKNQRLVVYATGILQPREFYLH